MFLFLSSRIIWLGDLNYRIALSYRSATALVEMQNWRALLENDQACFLSRSPVCLFTLFPNAYFRLYYLYEEEFQSKLLMVLLAVT
jgi:hypothetical protein